MFPMSEARDTSLTIHLFSSQRQDVDMFAEAITSKNGAMPRWVCLNDVCNFLGMKGMTMLSDSSKPLHRS